MYWELYLSEAEISDQKLVMALTANTESVLFLVSGEVWASNSPLN
jgi:hypothetical protein